MFKWKYLESKPMIKGNGAAINPQLPTGHNGMYGNCHVNGKKI